MFACESCETFKDTLKAFEDFKNKKVDEVMFMDM